jgi:hypothetical protein
MKAKGRGPEVRPEPPPPRSRGALRVRTLGLGAFTTAAVLVGGAVGGVLADDSVHAATLGALSALAAFLYATALMSRPGPADRS